MGQQDFRDHLRCRRGCWPGDGAPFVDRTGRQPIKGIKDNWDRDIFPFLARDRDQAPSLQGGGLIGRQSEAADVFYLSHELTHPMNWSPPALNQCLSDPKSLGARPKPTTASPDTIDFLVSSTKAAGASASIGYGTENFVAYSYLLGRNPLAARLLLDLLSGKKPISQLSDAEKQLIDTELGPAIRGLISQSTETRCDPKAASGTLTDLLTMNSDDLRRASLAAIKTATIARLAKNAVVSLGSFPEQMTEAIADYNATLTVARYIKQKYPNEGDRKKAALDVLKAWPPFLLPQESADVLNAVASKMTNEQRVFRIILANPEFRGLIGCTFEGETPGFCNGTDPVPSGQKRVNPAAKTEVVH